MKTYLEPSEIGLLEKETSNTRDRMLVRVLCHLGRRISEALILAIKDIDFSRRTVAIRRLKEGSGG
jgi:integrase/recombinase XerD